jgi:hypothetical protein
MFEANDKLGGCYTIRFVQLSLQYNSALQARPVGVRTLTFAKSQLVGDVCRQVSKRR